MWPWTGKSTADGNNCRTRTSSFRLLTENTLRRTETGLPTPRAWPGDPKRPVSTLNHTLVYRICRTAWTSARTLGVRRRRGSGGRKTPSQYVRCPSESGPVTTEEPVTGSPDEGNTVKWNWKGNFQKLRCDMCVSSCFFSPTIHLSLHSIFRPSLRRIMFVQPPLLVLFFTGTLLRN